jgi:Bacterial regulatory helix-turn-helix protein, lysR family
MSRSNDPLDAYLLHVFSTLMDERSVSRTATRLERSTYVIGTALRRLRVIFDDPLLLKDGQRLLPTERALQLADSLLGDIRASAPQDAAPTATLSPLTPVVVRRMRSRPQGTWIPSRRPAARLVRWS